MEVRTMAIQGGWRLTRFGVAVVVGIVLLTALVIGGLLIARDRGEQAQRAEAVKIAEEKLKQEADKGVALEVTIPGSEKDEAGEQGGANSSSETAQTPGTATQLPETGPEVLSIVAVGAISFAVASYIRSRKLILERQ